MKRFIDSFLTMWLLVGLFMLVLCVGTIVVALTLGLAYKLRALFEIALMGCIVPLVIELILSKKED